jgi:hypothetical protein
MAVIDLCASSGGNTGVIKCDVTRGNPKVMIVGNASFNASQYGSADNFKAALLAAMKLPAGTSGKMFPFPEIVGSANNTEANKEGTTGYGAKFILSEGRPAYTFDVIVGVNTEKNLRKFNKQTLPVSIFDDNSNYWGKRDAAGNLTGTLAQIYVSGTPFGDGNNLTVCKITVSFLSAADFYDFAAFVNTDFNPNDLEGLLDAEIAETVAHTSNAYHLGAYVRNASLGNDVNIHATYATELASASLWKAKTGPTFGTTLAITTVVDDPTNGGWTVTFDSTAYSALSSGASIKVGLVDPAALDTADVLGIESIPAIVKK